MFSLFIVSLTGLEHIYLYTFVYAILTAEIPSPAIQIFSFFKFQLEYFFKVEISITFDMGPYPPPPRGPFFFSQLSVTCTLNTSHNT